MSQTHNTVYLLWHVHELWAKEDDAKMIGVYATKADAKRAERRAVKLPGFSQHPKGFLINECEVGKDQWTEGFITVIPGTKLKDARTIRSTVRRATRRR